MELEEKGDEEEENVMEKETWEEVSQQILHLTSWLPRGFEANTTNTARE